MGFLAGIIGFTITFFMLRRRGGAGRHIWALVLGMAGSLILFGFWVAVTLPPGGNYRAGRLAGVWLFATVICLAMQLIAMLVALPIRRRALKKAGLQSA